MTIRNSIKGIIAIAAAALYLPPVHTAIAQEEAADDTPAAEEAPRQEAQKNPRRADSYREALSMAGDDGVAVFCYGPDWNQRSVRMLKKFWQTKQLEEAAGGAILVAAPFYQKPTPDQSAESSQITAGMVNPPFSVCPTVMLFDKNGFMYANLPGLDYLGDEEGTLGMRNIREKIAALRERDKLMAQAEGMSGEEKARILSRVADLPIKSRPGLVEMIKSADPSDQTGLVRRNTHDAKQFLYKQMDTKDGFLSKDFVADYKKIQTECMKVVKDEALRTIDRQRAYALIIGQTRRERISGKQMKDYIQACHKIDTETPYGKLTPTLANLWGNLNFRMTAEERRVAHSQAQAKDKERKNKEREDKKAAKNATAE